MHRFATLLFGISTAGARHVVTVGQPLKVIPVVDLESGENVELHLRELELVLPDGTSTFTRAYDEQLPSRTIRTEAGSELRVEIFNDLGHDSADNFPHQNGFNSPNLTNFHTHGLHVTSKTPGDNIMDIHINPAGPMGSSIQPGQHFQYVYKIPSYHQAGTHWYHPHNHGSTAIQSGGGAAGFLILKDRPGEVPPEIANMPEIFMAVFTVDLNITAEIERESQGDLWQGSFPELKQPGGTLILVNGHLNPKIAMVKDRWYRLRIVYSSIEARILWEWAGNTQCELQMIAKDGIYLNFAPREIHYFPLAPGTRVDIALRCSAEGSYAIRSTDRYESSANGFYRLNDDFPWATLEVTRDTNVWTANMEAVPLRFFAVQRPCYLVDLKCASENLVEAHMNWTFSVPQINGGSQFVLNGKEFNHSDPNAGTEGKFHTGQMVSFDLAGTDFHPFHQHVFPFQIQDVSQTDYPDFFQNGDWHDTLANPKNPKVRVQLTEFTGNIIVHCHVLKHEDKGMMGWYEVGGEEGAVWAPASTLDTSCFRDSSRGYTYTDAPLTCARLSEPEEEPEEPRARLEGSCEARCGLRGFGDISFVPPPPPPPPLPLGEFGPPMYYANSLGMQSPSSSYGGMIPGIVYGRQFVGSSFYGPSSYGPSYGASYGASLYGPSSYGSPYPYAYGGPVNPYPYQPAPPLPPPGYGSRAQECSCYRGCGAFDACCADVREECGFDN